MHDRDENDVLTEAIEIPYEHPGAIAATTAYKLRTARATMRVVLVEYDNPTGFAADAANYWTVQLLKGATVIASWSTLSTAQGALPADTFVNLINSATDTNLVCAKGDVLSLKLVKTGTPGNLPLGRICARCKYV